MSEQRKPSLRGAISALLSFVAVLFYPAALAAEECAPASAWTIPGTGRTTAREVLERAAQSRVVLLGEAHDDGDHHRWQLQTAAALAALRGNLILGFEMFPRRVQGVLDRWVAGELDEAAFLKASDWDQVWGFATDYYLPLFHLARINGFPMLALNVERKLVRAISSQGWDAVAESEREGIGDPAPASEAYTARLFKVYAQHPEKKDRPAERGDPAFKHFVQAQLTWDRAMAQAIALAAQRKPDALIVGIIGREHLAYGEGVKHQLANLGVDRVSILLPWDSGTSCSDFAPGLADAVFGLPPEPAAPPAPPPQLLGVRIEDVTEGVRIVAVTADSIAAAAGLQAGDILVEAAGRALKTAGDLRTVVTHVYPGTWLPLKLLRAGAPLELNAKFPPAK